MREYIVNGTLIDGTGAPPRALNWLAIEGGRITEVEIAAIQGQPDRSLPHDAKVLLDAQGMTVMPGIVDAHCHISYGVARGIEEQDLYGSPEYRALRGVWHAKKILQSGVTAFSDPGGSWYVGVAVRDAIRSGMFEGPRISAAARYLSSHTSLTDYFPTWVGSPKSAVGVLTKNAEEMLNEVREQVKNGVDLVKIAASGESAITTPGGGSVPAFRAEEIKLITDEAHRLGKKVTAHARHGQSVIDCIDAGIDWIMHADYMTHEHAHRLADSGIPCCPTLTFLANISDYGKEAGCSQPRIDRIRKNYDEASEALTYAKERGVTMMCGTDSGFAVTPYGEWHAREMEIFVERLGMSPLEAITCGTRNSSIAVDPKNIGTLQVGKLADVLIMKKDPLLDIRVLQDKRSIAAVFLGGKLVDRTPQAEAIRFPWEKNMDISLSELRHDDVRVPALS